MQCTPDASHVRVLNLGPFTTKVDDGLPLRRAALQTIATLVQRAPKTMAQYSKKLFTCIADALSDTSEMQVHAYEVMTAIATFSPAVVCIPTSYSSVTAHCAFLYCNHATVAGTLCDHHFVCFNSFLISFPFVQLLEGVDSLVAPLTKQVKEQLTASKLPPPADITVEIEAQCEKALSVLVSAVRSLLNVYAAVTTQQQQRQQQQQQQQQQQAGDGFVQFYMRVLKTPLLAKLLSEMTSGR